MRFSTALKLGRVSNLPTIWTNVLVGLGLSAQITEPFIFVLACAIFSLFYLAGMYLNDAFDAEWDALHNKLRPIPSGEVSLQSVIGFAFVFIGIAIAATYLVAEQKLASTVLVLLLLVCILIYDWKHKSWPLLAPVFMGACRLLVYVGAASLYAGWHANNILLLCAGSVLLYIAGITALARSEHENIVTTLLPIALLFAPCVLALVLGYKSTHAILMCLFALAWTVRAIRFVQQKEGASVPKAISALLAGICLIDAAFLMSVNAYTAAIFCVFAFLACLLLQRKIAAT